MSVVLSILTAADLLHVSDLPPEGPRTLLVRHPRYRGLMTVTGSPPPLAWVKAAAAAERHEAGALAQHIAALNSTRPGARHTDRICTPELHNGTHYTRS